MSDRSEPPRRPLLGNGERLRQSATRPRGGGDKFHPISPQDAWASLAPQARALSAGIDTLPREVVGHHLVIEATLRPNYLASSHFPAAALEGLYVVGARPARGQKITKTKVENDQRARRLLIAGPEARVKRFASRLATAPNAGTAKQWDELRRFSEVSLPRTDSVIVRRPEGQSSARVTFEAVITHVGEGTHERRWADEHFAQFVAWVRACGGTVDEEYRRDLHALTFVPVLASPGALDRIAQFNLLRAIRPMPEIAPLPDDMLRTTAAMPTLSRMAQAGERPGHAVAVFDGGVEASLSVFAPFVSAFDLTSEPRHAGAMRHGSLVTSAVLYGNVVPGTQLPDPTVCVDHYRVFPMPMPAPNTPDRRLYQALDKIIATLRAKRYPIVVLAMGPNESIDDAVEPDRFTAELDALQKELDIVVISAVGNNGGLDSALGYDRVQPPADCVNGIGVGAIDRSHHDPKKLWRRAHYSARGPGREGQRISPMIVEFGGSDDERFTGFDERGRLVTSMGTSFAAPTAGRILGGLQAGLAAHRHIPEMFRAFSAHYAGRGRGHGKRYLDLGFGRLPPSLDAAFQCAPNEVTVLYEDELPRESAVAMRFPFPAGLRAEVKLEIRWTIAFTSDVDPRDAADYTLSGIEAIFRPDSRVRNLTDPSARKSEEVRTDVDNARIVSALARGFTLSEEPKAHSGWDLTKGEQRLRRDGKWETIVPGRVLAKAGELWEPRLDLQHLRRQNGQLVRGDGIEPLRFVMLLTIAAPNGVVLYDLVASQYPVLTPIVRVPVRIRGVA